MDIKDVAMPSTSSPSTTTSPTSNETSTTTAVADDNEFGPNPRGLINEQCQRSGALLALVESDSGELNSSKRFSAAVKINEDYLFDTAYGASKKAAQRSAAVVALRALKANPTNYPALEPKSKASASQPGKRPATSMGADSTTTDEMETEDIVTDSRTQALLASSKKNPVSLLLELSMKRKLAAPVWSFESTGNGNQQFTAKLTFADFEFPPMTGRSKKIAKERISLTALDMLVRTGKMAGINHPALPHKRILNKPIDPHRAQTVYEMIASTVDTLVYEESKTHPMVTATAKVIAGIVATNNVTGDAWVLSWGTGTRSLSGSNMRTDGTTVCDSHAEVLARRGFVRFIYAQLNDVLAGKETIFARERAADNRLVIKPEIHIHLYIDTAPCGDGRVFTIAENKKSMKAAGASGHTMTVHQPLMADPEKHGLMRSKIEMGEGTLPTKDISDIQTLDGITGGERLRTMSCSDKVMRWNVLGLQGTLLSLFVQPIYLRSLVVGTLCHHNHLCRAVCCRVEGVGVKLKAESPYFRVNHPIIAHAQSIRQRSNEDRDVSKSSLSSSNWNFADQSLELIDGGTGCVAAHPYTSRLCKKAMYFEYKKLCMKLGQPSWISRTYGETKTNVVAYEKAKQILYKYVKEQRYGHWLSKPREEKLFA